MNRSAIEVGAFTWARIQRLYDADAIVHWQRCEAEGLQCPQEVFAQLFSEEANNEDFAAIVKGVDYSALRASPFAWAQGRPFGRSPARRAVVGSGLLGVTGTLRNRFEACPGRPGLSVGTR
jgi:hypothetical protein